MNSHRIAFLIFAITLGCTDAYALLAADQKDAAYVGATVYDGTGAAEVIGVRGKFLIPGLINSHVHLATSPNPSAAKAFLLRELYSGAAECTDRRVLTQELTLLVDGADFVILDKDPLTDIRNIRSVYMTVKNGVGYKRSLYQPTVIQPNHP